MDDAERRAILREHGEEPPAKGKLGPDWVTRADSLRADTPDDYDGGVSAEDFADTTAAAEPPAAPAVAERKPRNVKTAGTRAPRTSLRDRFTKAKAKPGTKAKRHPRLSLAPIIGEFWGVMGSLAGRVDVPLGRCLQMQAPVAGEILEDVVKGTVVDTALQPLARAEDKAKAVGALILPPVCVMAIEHAHTLPEDQMKLRLAFLEPVLVQSLMMWERVAGEKVEAMAARVEAEAPSRERAVETARLIFAMAAPAAPAQEAETVGV